MFVAAVVNFLLASLNVGSQITIFIVFIRKALILNPDYPLLEKQKLVDDAIWKLNVVEVWAGTLPVSNNLSLPDFASNIAR